jgi:hypothetical protein
MPIGGIGGKDGSGSFVDTPMPSEFNENGSIPEGSAGIYDGKGGCPTFAEYSRTSSPNGVREKFYDKSNPLPSGEADHFD